MTKSKKIVQTLGFILLLSVATVCGSCTKEDNSDCSTFEVAYRQTINSDGVDKFESDVDRVSLYIFDSKGLFVGEFRDQGEHLNGSYRMKLPLNKGEYNLYVWGNLNGYYETTPLTVGVSKYDDALLRVKRGVNRVEGEPDGHLYHGKAQKIVVTGQPNQTQVIDMMKNVNFVRVVVKGFQLEDNLPSKAEVPSSITCSIVSPNGDYKFDNTMASSDLLHYKPKYNVEKGDLISDFTILRLFQGDATRLIVRFEEKELYNGSLAGLLIGTPGISSQEDLDRLDRYKIEITVDPVTNIVTSIEIKGWTGGGSGGIL